jgi:hypothetical protein
MMVRENSNVTLRCKAKGYPAPKISWRRENNKVIEYGNWQQLKKDHIRLRKSELHLLSVVFSL